MVYDQDRKIVGALQFLNVDNETATIDSVMAMIETIAPNWKEAHDWVTASVRKRGEISEQIQGDYKFSISTVLIPMFSASLVNAPVTDSLPGVDIPTSISVPTETPLPTNTPGPTPTPLVLEFTGEGDDVVIFDVPASGAALFGFGHRGERNFIVHLLRGDGSYVDLLVNDVGDYEGEKMHQLQKGQYVLEVTADGAWYAVILPPQ